jgi:ribulose-5-phosphate 4-epimerase/fuculose-1-phosphate aldolase
MNSEGTIKFRVENEPNPGCHAADIVELEKWRSRLRAKGLVGQNPEKYAGLGYGNLSRRMPDGTFLITASQTGHLEKLTPPDYARILRFAPRQNCVWSRGMKLPSSETLTHLAVYASNPHVRFVFHVHCPEVWQAKNALNLPATDSAVEYGTPEMFYAVQNLLANPENYQKGILAMGGHVDGLLTWGKTAAEAGQNILVFYQNDEMNFV